MSPQTSRAGQGVPLPRGAFYRTLFAKLVLGTLAVLVLVLAPTLFIVRQRIQFEVRDALRHELSGQARSIAKKLGAEAPDRVMGRIAEIVQLLPVRVTIIDPSGKVLADSDAAPESMENHRDRPEVRDALAQGTGSAIRESKTLSRTMIYAASTFPTVGPPRGIVRLALPTTRADEAAARSLDFLDTIAAAAATAAVLLSLIVAVFLTRGLRQIRRGALALAQGDLGVPISVRSRDEIGQVATALNTLAGELRSRLLESGADRSTLRALLDELPAGVIVCGRDGVPHILNGAARVLLDLAPATELEEARRLFERPEHAQVVARVLESRLSEDQLLAKKSPSGHPLRGRWVAVGREDGSAEPTLILWEDLEEERKAEQRKVVKWADELRAVPPHVSDPSAADALATVLQRMDRARVHPLPAADTVEAITISSLCEQPLRAARARASGHRITIEVELVAPGTLVVEANGRTEAALRHLFGAAVSASEPGASLRLRSHDSDTEVRLTLRVRAASIKTKRMLSQVAALGGSAGADADGEDVELWLAIPRA